MTTTTSLPFTESNNLLTSNLCIGGLVGLGSFLAFCVALIVLLWIFRRYKKLLRKNQRNIEFTETENSNSPYLHLLKPPKPLHENFQINAENITILNELGLGNTGYVSLAKYKTNFEMKNVALKISVDRRNNVSKEIQALNSCKHKNIVTFIGWTEIDDEIGIVMEYMSGGNLHSFLINPNNDLTVGKIFSFIFQILDAMVYLSEKHILHRQLMASNCLLNATNEILKISDFCLARKMDINYEYVSEESEALPFRWISLETLKYQKFTVKGDVWSFGVLVWEMFERGSRPYKELNLPELVNFLESGERLPCPQYCPYELYEKMKKCWNEIPDERPTFLILKEEIKNLYDELKAEEPNKTLTKIHEYVNI